MARGNRCRLILARVIAHLTVLPRSTEELIVGAKTSWQSRVMIAPDAESFRSGPCHCRLDALNYMRCRLASSRRMPDLLFSATVALSENDVPDKEERISLTFSCLTACIETKACCAMPTEWAWQVGSVVTGSCQDQA